MSSVEQPQSAIPATEITIVTGDRYRVQGGAKDIEKVILDAARGSIMQFAWLIEAKTGQDFAVDPKSVVLLRAADA